MRAFRIILVLLLVFVFAGCAKQGHDPALTLALKSISVSDIVVEVSPAVQQGMISTDVNGVTDREKAPAVAQALKDALTARIASMSRGTEKARLHVMLTSLDVASGVGRLAGASSHLKGMVRLEKVGSHELIADLGHVTAEDGAAHLGGNIGFVASVVYNAATAASEDRTQALANSFADKVKTYFE